MEDNEYICPNCKRKVKAATAPDCCGGKMEQLPLNVCTSAPSPEHSRPMEDEEPCDDSRGG